MTKKHLIALAAVIKNLRSVHGDNIPAIEMERVLANMCAESNPAFKFAVFHAACKPE